MGEGSEGRAGGRERWQSRGGDVSTCHVVVITCAGVAARLLVVALVRRRSGERGRGGGRDSRSCGGGGRIKIRLGNRIDQNAFIYPTFGRISIIAATIRCKEKKQKEEKKRK